MKLAIERNTMTYFRALILFSFIFTTSYATAKESSAPGAKPAVPSATPLNGEDHKSEGHDKHKHGTKCGHKSEAHGDHTDYEHTKDGHKHHHKEHAGHYDECDGPEGEAKAK